MKFPHYVVYEDPILYTGYEAIKFAEENDITWLDKYNDPADPARAVRLEEAKEIARENPSLIYIEFIDEDGTPVDMPSRKEVCWRCDGRGTHTKPGIDDHGLTAEDFAEDPDFAEDYYRGRYDVTCSVCKGRNVIDVPDDRVAWSELQQKAHENFLKWQEDDWRHQQEIAAEIRAGC